ncbi:thiopurine S-methyltransferase [Vibrio hannami]|uniref:thiopurine S-methyltransferase n=1 Tax=Vibrio hannami TaxID=2717094 RepID=UPI0024108D1B|nr:thiopurine S-methyltransferase [Vibrio hannami]MDG3088017.1 thiopurine S-methyltransferase [Vibrio hannami]
MRDREFWHNKWASNKIGFHLEDVNPLLTEYWPIVNAAREDKVFVPLCGKTEDLVWLACYHNDVQGVELSDIAVRSFFAEHFYTPLVTKLDGSHELYQFDELTIFAGDFFTAPLKPCNVVYDRAALIALPDDMREEYVERIKLLLEEGGKILLVTLDYVQSEMAGPPFSVPESEVRRLFSEYQIKRLTRNDASEDHPKISQKGLSRFAEEVWLIEDC